MATMVGMGKERRAAMTDLTNLTIWWRQRQAEGWPQGTLMPLQKNLLRVTMMRAELPLMDWVLTWERAERRVNEV